MMDRLWKHHNFYPEWIGANCFCQYCKHPSEECKGKSITNKNYKANLFQDADGLFWGLRTWLCCVLYLGGLFGVVVLFESAILFTAGKTELIIPFLIITFIIGGIVTLALWLAGDSY